MDKMFSILASKYDLFNRLASLSLDEYWRNRLVSNVDHGARMNILDVCTGTGELAIKLAVRTKGRVWGIDFCKEMLQIAKQKAKSCRQEVDFVLEKAENLSFRGDNFDVVVSGFAMRNVIHNLEVVLKEMRRVLKTNGRLMILEMGVPDSKFVRKIYFTYLKSIMPMIGSIIYGNRAPFLYLKKSIVNSFSPKEMKEKLKKIGFRDVHYVPISKGITGIYKAVK